MAMTDLASAARTPSRASHGFSSARRFDPATPLDGAILPSLVEETLLEMELALAAYDGREDFVTAVSRAAREAGGAFLFELPASDMLPGSRRVGVVSLPASDGWLTAFACVEADGQSIRIEQPDERSEPLHRFAQSFIGVLGRLKTSLLPARKTG